MFCAKAVVQKVLEQSARNGARWRPELPESVKFIAQFESCCLVYPPTQTPSRVASSIPHTDTQGGHSLMLVARHKWGAGENMRVCGLHGCTLGTPQTPDIVYLALTPMRGHSYLVGNGDCFEFPLEKSFFPDLLRDG